jgi:hypothetical protein
MDKFFMSVVESYLRSENIIHFRNAIRKHEIDNNYEEVKSYCIEYCRTFFESGVVPFRTLPASIFEMWTVYIRKAIEDPIKNRDACREIAYQLFLKCEKLYEG